MYFSAILKMIEATYSLPPDCHSGSPSLFGTCHRTHIYKSFILLKGNILQIHMLIPSMSFDMF